VRDATGPAASRGVLRLDPRELGPDTRGRTGEPAQRVVDPQGRGMEVVEQESRPLEQRAIGIGEGNERIAANREGARSALVAVHRQRDGVLARGYQRRVDPAAGEQSRDGRNGNQWRRVRRIPEIPMHSIDSGPLAVPISASVTRRTTSPDALVIRISTLRAGDCR